MGLSFSFEDFNTTGAETVINICPKVISIMIDIEGFTLTLFSDILSPMRQYFLFASCIYRLFGGNLSCMSIAVRFTPSFLVGHCCESFGSLVSSRQAFIYKQ